MRKLIFITTVIIAITASSLSLFAQKIEPEELSFKKTYQMPGMSQEELYRHTRQWENTTGCVKFEGADLGMTGKYYSLHLPNQKIGDKNGAFSGMVYLKYYDGYFDLIFTSISFRCGHKTEHFISTHDDTFNRTRLWLLMHNESMIENARQSAAKIFDHLCYAMSEYLKTGPEDTFSMTAM